SSSNTPTIDENKYDTMDFLYRASGVKLPNNINSNEASLLHYIDTYNLGLSVSRKNPTSKNWNPIKKGNNDQVIDEPCKN
ncbi:MAG: hypothetical protein JST62_13785, partial [Bacteroidetes bacterium]|nr:hypothetical protein [Bacteroidota bacterium]